jgi:hypothetical protein
VNPAAETAEPGPAAPVRPATGVVWAWWSKRAKTARDYAVVDANIGAEHWPAINAEIDRLGVGNPSSGSAPGRALPWIAFAGRPGRDPEQRVLVWDWTGESDVGGRPIVGVLYLRLPADRRAGLRVLAEYAFHAWHAVRDDRSVVLPEPPGAVPQPDMLQWLEDEDQLRWIAAVAALALVRPVRVVGGEEHTLAHNSSRVWLFDAVEALLPAGVQPLLSHASWLNDAKNERYQLALSRPPEQAPSTGWAGAPPAAVTWPQPPDLGGDPAAAHYRDTLLEMRARHTLTAVVGHLARHAEPLLALGPDTAAACADYLGRIDMLYKVGLDLLATRPADLDTVRELTHTHRLDSLPPQMHLEFLRFLLRHGDAVDLPPVVANWLPGTMPVLADAALERAADGRADLPDWLDACLRPTLAALPAAYTTDALLAALLGGFRPDDAAGELLVQATAPAPAGHRSLADGRRARPLRPPARPAAADAGRQAAPRRPGLARRRRRRRPAALAGAAARGRRLRLAAHGGPVRQRLVDRPHREHRHHPRPRAGAGDGDDRGRAAASAPRREPRRRGPAVAAGDRIRPAGGAGLGRLRAAVRRRPRAARSRRRLAAGPGSRLRPDAAGPRRRLRHGEADVPAAAGPGAVPAGCDG